MKTCSLQAQRWLIHAPKEVGDRFFSDVFQHWRVC